MGKQPERGHVIFYDKCPPPLYAGDYELHVDQKMEALVTTENPDNTYSSEKKAVDADAASGNQLPSLKKFPFEITGPRFTLQPDEIHAAYPPPNSDGPFEARLPCVVLKRRTLPWERKSGSIGAEDLPWLALLLFEEDEVELLDPPDCTVGKVLNHTPNFWQGGGGQWPPNTLAQSMSQQELDKPCLGIEVKKDKFEEVAPTKKELQLLTHVRQVNTQDKELLGQDKDGWFAVVVGNRLPVSGKKYVACLISLENQADILPNAGEVLETPRGANQGYTVSVEMAYRTAVNLYLRDLQSGSEVPSATFDSDMSLSILARYMGDSVRHVRRAAARVTTAARAAEVNDVRVASRADITVAPGQFSYDIAENVMVLPAPSIRLICLARWTFQCEGKGDFQGLMEALPEAGGIGMLGMPPNQTTNNETIPKSKYRAALDSGHIPLKHLSRDGENKTSLYRGPFTAVGVKRNLSEGPYHDADQARRVDPLTGLENLGYAAAFEIGRLMALADARFALELLKWRRDGHRRVGQYLVGTRIKTLLEGLFDSSDLLRFLDDRFLTAGLMDRIGPRILHEQLLGPLTDPTGLSDLRERLPGMDPVSVMEALNLDAAAVEAMMGVDLGSGVAHGDILGSAGLLEDLGLAETGLMEMGFESVVTNVAREFGHLNHEHNQMMDQYKGVNSK
jgi:hypothetical protein